MLHSSAQQNFANNLINISASKYLQKVNTESTLKNLNTNVYLNKVKNNLKGNVSVGNLFKKFRVLAKFNAFYVKIVLPLCF